MDELQLSWLFHGERIECIQILSWQFPLAMSMVFLGWIFLYWTNYGVVTSSRRMQDFFTILTIGTFIITHFQFPVDCAPYLPLRNVPCEFTEFTISNNFWLIFHSISSVSWNYEGPGHVLPSHSRQNSNL